MLTASPSANIGAAPRRSPRAPKRGLQAQDSSPRTRSKTSQKLRAAGVPAEVELAAEDEYDEEYQPLEVSDVEEEYDEGKIVDDERPPFDNEPAKADPELIDELQKAAEDAAEGEEYEPKEAESEVEEEYDEGEVKDDERPPFDDDAHDSEREVDASVEYDEAGDADFKPAAESDVEEEYDEGKIVDDERPPFDDEPAKADPELIDELQKAAEDAAEGEEYEPKEAESEVEEEYDEADAVPDTL